MRGWGTHHQPAGTWSDDAALTFCLVDSLVDDYSPADLGRRFVNWLYDGYWTPHGDVFDVGGTTRTAIQRLAQGVKPTQAGPAGEYDNGNGSIMRILPLVFALGGLTPEARFARIRDVSCLTHGHIRAITGCFIYVEYARLLREGLNKFSALQQLQHTVPGWLATWDVPADEIIRFDRVLTSPLYDEPKHTIRSTGYVIDSLEASIWCLLTSDTFTGAVLEAVNMGEDTDTTGAVTGGLAGLYYGFEAIPTAWVNTLARRDDILAIADRLSSRFIPDPG